MVTQSEPKIVVIRAAAAAIVTARNLSNGLKKNVDQSKKFVVHPHVADVGADDALLRAYLRRIYTAKKSVEASAASNGDFDRLAKPSTVAPATKAIAEAMAEEMAKKNATPGILFGFSLKVDGAKAHGIIKADLDDEQRFHFITNPNGEWSLGEVKDILPPPSIDYAKFAIAPQPGGTGSLGVLDVTQKGTAADYFLSATLLQVPRVKGTKAAVAQVAARSGYDHDEIHERLQEITEDAPVADVIRDKFPDVPLAEVERLEGSTARPMPTVIADDHYVRTYKTARPLFELRVDDDVTVVVNGRVVTVTLPSGSDEIQRDIRPR